MTSQKELNEAETYFIRDVRIAGRKLAEVKTELSETKMWSVHQFPWCEVLDPVRARE